jgi:outer membrane lipoprotein-sorting protein
VLAALGLLAVAPGARASDPVASAPEEVLARMRARQAALETLKARIEQTKSYPQLGLEDPAESGLFRLERDSKRGTRVRIEIQVPDTRVLIVAEGRYQLYQPRLRQAIEGELVGSGPKGLFSGVLSGSPEAVAQLERDYVVEGEGGSDVDGRPVYDLRFTAKKGAEVYCREIELAVDAELYLPVRQRCREANDSLVTFTLSGIEVDAELEKGLFDLELPKGVQKVKG